MADQREYEFTLVLDGDVDVTEDNVANALYEAGCDDALPCWRSGRSFLTFDRAAPSLKDAIISAIRDVKAADMGAEVLRVEHSSLVTQAEIARRANITRQAVNNYFQDVRGPGGFPSPVSGLSDDDDTLLWNWGDVARWLSKNKMIHRDAADKAQIVDIINNWLERGLLQKQSPDLARELHELIDG